MELKMLENRCGGLNRILLINTKRKVKKTICRKLNIAPIPKAHMVLVKIFFGEKAFDKWYLISKNGIKNIQKKL
jgi:hypothetical protein